MHKPSPWQYLLLLAIPALVVFLAFDFMQMRGPFYTCAHSDPNYFYLNNALNLAVAKPANHVDNPGSSTQLIGGLTIRAITFFKGTDDIEREVLLNPEYYLNAINKTLVLLNVLALCLLGFFALRWTGNLQSALLLQYAPLVSWQTFRVFVKVSPEPVLLLAAVFLTMLLLRVVVKNDLKERTTFYTLLFALIISFGLAAKLTFIPMLFIPLMLLPGWRSKVAFLAATAVLFHVFIIPAYAHYDYFIKWITDLFFHSGQYGGGPADIVNFGAFFHHLLQLLFLHHAFYVVVAIAVGTLLYYRFNPTWKTIFQNEVHIKMLLAVTVAVAIQTLLVAKHYSPHYLVPYFALAPFLVFLVLEIWKKGNPAFSARAEKGSVQWKLIAIWAISLLLFLRHYVKYLPGQSMADWLKNISLPLGIVMVMLMVFSGWASRLPASNHTRPASINKMLYNIFVLLLILYCIRDADLNGFQQRLITNRNDAQRVMEFVDRNYHDVPKVYCANASSQVCALHFGASINFSQPDRLEKLSQLYDHANVHFLHVDFTYWQHELDSLTRQHGIMMLQADTNGLRHIRRIEIEQRDHINFREVYAAPMESVYELTRK